MYSFSYSCLRRYKLMMGKTQMFFKSLFLALKEQLLNKVNKYSS